MEPVLTSPAPFPTAEQTRILSKQSPTAKQWNQWCRYDNAAVVNGFFGASSVGWLIQYRPDTVWQALNVCLRSLEAAAAAAAQSASSIIPSAHQQEQHGAHREDRWHGGIQNLTLVHVFFHRGQFNVSRIVVATTRKRNQVQTHKTDRCSE